MLIKNNILSGVKPFFLIVMGVMVYSSSALSEYVPFPGKLKVRLVNIEAANVVNVNFETWPGFGRTLRVTLPDVVLPGSSEKPAACELELANKALDLTTKYLKSANEISIIDVKMETSADTDVVTAVYTEKGSLAQALQKKGLARPSSVDSKTPWCK